MSTVNVRSHINGLHVPLPIDVAPKITSLYRTKGGNDLIFDSKSLGKNKAAKKTVVKMQDDKTPTAEFA